MLRILQLTDLHIGHLDEKPNGVDVRNNFLKAVDLAKGFNPDLLVITGDLSFQQGNKETYKWIREQLTFPDLRIYAIAGNHDNSHLLAEVFHPEKPTSSEGKLYFFSHKKGELFLFLDSWDGKLGNQQFSWIEETLSAYKPDRLFIFMHHPPLLSDVPHMDGKHSFKEIDRFYQLTEDYGKPVHVFTGHYHFQKNLIKGNLFVHIAPSSFFQMKGDNPYFEKDHDLPGVQIIDIDKEKVSVHSHFAF